MKIGMIGNDITTSLAEETNHLYSGVNIRGDTGDMSHSGRRTWAFIPISSNKNMKVAKELFRGGRGGEIILLSNGSFLLPEYEYEL